jgi:hypothetical protein
MGSGQPNHGSALAMLKWISPDEDGGSSTVALMGLLLVIITVGGSRNASTNSPAFSRAMK